MLSLVPKLKPIFLGCFDDAIHHDSSNGTTKSFDHTRLEGVNDDFTNKAA